MIYFDSLSNATGDMGENEPRMENEPQPDRSHFFLSYTGQDRQWAEWIAWQVEQAGYTVFIQAWDIGPGSNFVVEMHQATIRAERTLLVLSAAYLESAYGLAEWAAAFRADPTGTQRKVLPVRIEACQVDGLLGPIGSIDLVGFSEDQARERLLKGVTLERAKPETAPFPPRTDSRKPVAFPGVLTALWNIPYSRNPVFTGREQLLVRLTEALQPEGATVALSQPQAITGLGGIGKTQLAVEYAYQHHQDYQAILWTRADTQEALIAGYVAFAQMLGLPQKDEQDQQRVAQAVLEWLKREARWLPHFFRGFTQRST
jgi:hypothetical protein